MAFYKVNHNPLAFTFGILGNIISFLMYLAPVPTFYQIYKDKSTGEFKSLPYLVGLFSSMLWLYYGLLKPDAAALVTINSFGCIVELVYNIMFITYATPDAKKSTIRLFVGMNMACFSMIFLFTQLGLREPVLRVQFLGWVSVFVSVSVFAAPLSIATEVIRTKSVQFMPISLSFFLTLSAVVWFFYGFFLKDKRIAVPNVIGFILGIFQMVLYGVYRKYDAKKEYVKEQQELEIVVGQEEEKKKEAQ